MRRRSRDGVNAPPAAGMRLDPSPMRPRSVAQDIGSYGSACPLRGFGLSGLGVEPPGFFKVAQFCVEVVLKGVEVFQGDFHFDRFVREE